MRFQSILTFAAVAALAACKHEEPATGETNTTSAPAPVENRDLHQPATEMPGTPNDTAGTTEGTTRSGSIGAGSRAGDAVDNGNTATTSWGTMEKGKDAGVKQVTPTPNTQGAQGKAERNTSTTLGDGTSGTYTGNQGTYGGKATQGTGVKTPENTTPKKP